MKKSTLALVVMGIVASVSVQAAEIYNKDGNKLDVYGKVKAMHYMSDNDSKDGDQSYIRFGFKGETQINVQLTGYGRWEAEFAGNKAESDTAQQKTRLAFAGLKYKDLGSFIMVVTWACCMTWKPGPICSRNLVATPRRRPTTL